MKNPVHNDQRLKEELCKFLSGFVLERRLELFNQILSLRTRYITVVLEDVYQAQNASAVIRTCDCFGIQDIHLVEERNKFRVDGEVSLGSHKWINLHHYKTISNVVKILRRKGYRIVSTVPAKNSVSLYDFNVLKGPSALLFGTELSGLSDAAIKSSDECISIPMFGFTDSFNISVSVALCLQYLVRKMHDEMSTGWKLTPDERTEVLLNWLRKSIRSSELIEKRFHETLD